MDPKVRKAPKFQGHLPHSSLFFRKPSTTQGNRSGGERKNDGCKEWKRNQPLEKSNHLRVYHTKSPGKLSKMTIGRKESHRKDRSDFPPTKYLVEPFLVEPFPVSAKHTRLKPQRLLVAVGSSPKGDPNCLNQKVKVQEFKKLVIKSDTGLSRAKKSVRPGVAFAKECRRCQRPGAIS